MKKLGMKDNLSSKRCELKAAMLRLGGLSIQLPLKINLELS